jgi:hypothetical protein
MTVVRIASDIDDPVRSELLRVLRAQDDVTYAEVGVRGLELELAGYQPAAAEARAFELLRTAALETGIDPAIVSVVNAVDRSDEGLA